MYDDYPTMTFTFGCADDAGRSLHVTMQASGGSHWLIVAEDGDPVAVFLALDQHLTQGILLGMAHDGPAGVDVSQARSLTTAPLPGLRDFMLCDGPHMLAIQISEADSHALHGLLSNAQRLVSHAAV